MAQATAAAVQAVPNRPLAERPEAPDLDPGGAPFAGLMAHLLQAPPASGTPAQPKEAPDQDAQSAAEPDAVMASVAAGVPPAPVAPTQEAASPAAAPATASLEALGSLAQPGLKTPAGAAAVQASATPQSQAGAKPSQSAAPVPPPALVPLNALPATAESPAVAGSASPMGTAPTATQTQPAPVPSTQGETSTHPAIPAQSPQAMLQGQGLPASDPAVVPTPELKMDTAQVATAAPAATTTTAALPQAQPVQAGSAPLLRAETAQSAGPSTLKAGPPRPPQAAAPRTAAAAQPETTAAASLERALSVQDSSPSPAAPATAQTVTAARVTTDTAAAARTDALPATAPSSLERAQAGNPSAPAPSAASPVITIQAKVATVTEPVPERLPLAPSTPPESDAMALQARPLAGEPVPQAPNPSASGPSAAPAVITIQAKVATVTEPVPERLPLAPAAPPESDARALQARPLAGEPAPQAPTLQGPAPVAAAAIVPVLTKGDTTKVPATPVAPAAAAAESEPLLKDLAQPPTLPTTPQVEAGHPTPRPTIQALLAESALRQGEPTNLEHPAAPIAAPVAAATSSKAALPQATDAPVLSPGQVATPARVTPQAAPLAVPAEVTSGTGRGPLQPALTTAATVSEADPLDPKPAAMPVASHLHAQDGSSMVGQSAVSRATEAVPVATPVPTAAPAPPPSAQVLQMEGGLRWMLKGGAQEAQLQLHPEALGQVTIHLKVEGGEVHARIWVTEAASVQAVREGRPHLELSLKEQGLHLGSFDLQQGRRPHQEPPAPSTFSERIVPEVLSARQEAPAPLAPAVLNPHHVELYA